MNDPLTNEELQRVIALAPPCDGSKWGVMVPLPNKPYTMASIGDAPGAAERITIRYVALHGIRWRDDGGDERQKWMCGEGVVLEPLPKLELSLEETQMLLRATRRASDVAMPDELNAAEKTRALAERIYKWRLGEYARTGA